MKITLVRKYDSSDKDPLIVTMIEGDDAKAVKRTFGVNIGEVIELPDQQAYDILARYKGLFEITSTSGTTKAAPIQAQAAQAAQGKAFKGYADKALKPDTEKGSDAS